MISIKWSLAGLGLLATGDGFVAIDRTLPSTSSQLPEPSTFIIWSLLAALGIMVGWWRRRRKA
jgi:hypothetical protein